MTPVTRTTLAARTFKPNSAQSVIETRSATPSAPLFLRFYEIDDTRAYELWRGLYKGRLVMRVFVPWRMR